MFQPLPWSLKSSRRKIYGVPLGGKKEGMGQESVKGREMKQKRVADRVKKSKGGFSVGLHGGERAKRGGGGGLRASVWGAEIYVAVKLGYSLLYGALPAPRPPRPACTHLTTLTFTLTEKQRFLGVLRFPGPATFPFPPFTFFPPSSSSLPYNNRASAEEG